MLILVVLIMALAHPWHWPLRKLPCVLAQIWDRSSCTSANIGANARWGVKLHFIINFVGLPFDDCLSRLSSTISIAHLVTSCEDKPSPINTTSSACGIAWLTLRHLITSSLDAIVYFLRTTLLFKRFLRVVCSPLVDILLHLEGVNLINSTRVESVNIDLIYLFHGCVANHRFNILMKRLNFMSPAWLLSLKAIHSCALSLLTFGVLELNTFVNSFWWLLFDLIDRVGVALIFTRL